MKILFYPDKVISYARIRPILAGHEIVEDIDKPYDAGIYWNLKSVNAPNEKLINSDKKILNLTLNDVSKSKVMEVYKKVFKKDLAVDPETYEGKAVVKKDMGHGNKGNQIVKCPTKRVEGMVYQKLLQNIPVGPVIEYRVFIAGKIVTVIEKKKKLARRFASDSVIKAKYGDAEEFFSKSEITKINKFCKEIGLDYGELDVMRDKDLYILDVNNIPGSAAYEYWDIEAYRTANKKILEALIELWS
jgi:hypothetical protein